MLIKAAINGGRTKVEHAAVPVTPEEQAVDVIQCLKAGANAIHLHVRSTSGQESLEAEDVALTVRTVRSASPNTQIGASTGVWILSDPSLRFQAIAAWNVLPDFASVNFIEDGSVELAHLLLSRGVDVEAGLSEEEAADTFIRSDLAGRCLRVLLEPQEQEMKKALETVSWIEKVLESGEVKLRHLLSFHDS
ncbi:MAG: 3-keto-5-aminohexanoate cleavage protein [Acidobacteriota bacterium]|nr:3-keto-5-aminohexanoate cleavage protein [Acidobacteriota bacterium]